MIQETAFQQHCHHTGKMHLVIINPAGQWRTVHRFLDTLEAFQLQFGCSDEEMVIIKLKYGNPVCRFFRELPL